MQEQQGIKKPGIVLFLGGPGSGKGTQSDIMAKRYGFAHYSTGDLLREFIKTDSPEAEETRNLMKEGKLASSELLVDLLKRKIFENGPHSGMCVLDGFPRSAHSFSVWKDIMKDEVQVKTLLSLECPFQTLESRLLERAKASQRTDDNRETILKRINTFKEETQPFIKHYMEHIGPVDIIDGKHSIADVAEAIRKALIDKKAI